MSAAGSPNGLPKGLSSRLLTMKFMQRAAASPSSPADATPEEPPAKRRKTLDTSPSSFDINTLSDSRAVQAALAEEEARRQTAIERQAAEAGDGRWVLDFENRRNGGPPSSSIQVVQAGFANLDTSPQQVRTTIDEPGDNVIIGRRSFGNFNRVIEKQNPGIKPSETDSESGSEDSEDESDEESGGFDASGNNPRETSRTSQNRNAHRVKGDHRDQTMAESGDLSKGTRKRRGSDTSEGARKKTKKESNGPGLTSLTGRQDPKCFRCNGPHLQAQCPKRRYDSQDGRIREVESLERLREPKGGSRLPRVI